MVESLPLQMLSTDRVQWVVAAVENRSVDRSLVVVAESRFAGIASVAVAESCFVACSSVGPW